MSTKRERKKVPVKSVYTHIIKAKLYGILTINSLEGIIHEIDEMLPQETLDEPLDIFSTRFRRYQNGSLMPTSYGDHLDRAAKSLCKDVGASVSIELFNTQAIKKVITSCILTSAGDERVEYIDWLTLPNEIILKSERYEGLINFACMYYYKEMVTNISEDTLAFVRRSANELLRNKASKEAIRKKLLQNQTTRPDGVDDLRGDVPIDMIQSRVPFVNDVSSVDTNQLAYLIQNSV